MATDATDVLSLDEAKRELRVEGTDHDTLITAHLEVAVQHVSDYIDQPLLDTADEVVASIPCDSDMPVEVRRSAVKSVQSVQYWEPDGSLNADPGGTQSIVGRLEQVSNTHIYRIWPPDGGWPDALDESYFIVNLTRGLEATKSIKQAVAIVLTQLYDGVEEESQSMKWLLAPYKRGDLMV